MKWSGWSVGWHRTSLAVSQGGPVSITRETLWERKIVMATQHRGRRRREWFGRLGQRKTPWDAIKTKTMIRTTTPITHPKTFHAWADE